MTIADGKAFVDTGILLRALHNTLPLHNEARTLIRQMWNDDIDLWINRQVIREYLVQATHPRTFTQPLTLEQIMMHMQSIQFLFRIADDTREVTAQLLELLKTYPTGGKQVHDANIIATRLVYGIDTLLTINIEDMKRFADRVKILPLVGEAK